MLQPPAGSRLPPKSTGAHDDQIFDDSYLEDLKLLEQTNQHKDITAEQFVEEQVGLERAYSKTDLQQSCSQELAKELDLINGGFYEFQEKAFRIIGQHLIAIVGDSTTTEAEKQKKITELYDHDELYWILGQYGLKHVALIKLIEKLKHHSYGLTREQIKLLEKYGMPEHVNHVKLFLESQLIKMPPTTRQQKQDLIYKVIEVASVYNMSLPEEQWITEPEINALAESMSDVLYNINTVEDDRKQMLRSPNPPRRYKAIEHFSTHYISNMIKNDTVMTYSARLDHFLQMMIELKGELDKTTVRDQRVDTPLPRSVSIFQETYNTANQNYILHSNERIFNPEIEDLFFRLCLVKAYESSRATDQEYESTRRTDEIREEFNNKVGPYLDEMRQTYLKDQDVLLKYLLSEVAPADEVEKNFDILKKVYGGNIYTREQISEVQAAVKADTSFEIHILLLTYLYQYFGEATGSIVTKAGSAHEVDEFLVATATSEWFAKVTSHPGKYKMTFEHLGSAIKVVGGKEVGIFMREDPIAWDMMVSSTRGERFGRFIYAAGGAAAALKLHAVTKTVFAYIDGVYDADEEKRIKELGEEGKELARHEFSSKVYGLKSQLITAQVGIKYARLFSDAYNEASKIADSQVRKEMQRRLLQDISYEKVGGKPCVVFPKEVMPHPRSLEDPKPEELQEKLGAMNVSYKKKNSRFYYHTQLRLFGHPNLIAKYIPSREEVLKLSDRIRCDKKPIDLPAVTSSKILAHICNFTFSGYYNDWRIAHPGGSMEPEVSLKEDRDNEYIWVRGSEAFVVKRHGYFSFSENIKDYQALPVRCYAYPDDVVLKKESGGSQNTGPR